MKRKLTPEQAEERRTRRARRSIDAAAKVNDLRSWRETCIAAAEKARSKAAKKRAKAREEALAAGERPRGVDRVPVRTSLQRDPIVSSEPIDPFHRVSKHGTAIDSTLGVSTIDGIPVVGNHAYRRQVGARGHERPVRLRTLRAQRKGLAAAERAVAEARSRADTDQEAEKKHAGFRRRWMAGAR